MEQTKILLEKCVMCQGDASTIEPCVKKGFGTAWLPFCGECECDACDYQCDDSDDEMDSHLDNYDGGDLWSEGYPDEDAYDDPDNED